LFLTALYAHISLDPELEAFARWFADWSLRADATSLTPA